MTRSREEIISEMVDAGFSDDEIRAAFAPKKKPITAEQFGHNLIQDYSQNVRGQMELGAYAFPPLAAMKAAEGTNIYDPTRMRTIGEGIKNFPSQLWTSVRHPIESGYERPLSTVLDIASVASLAGQGARALRPIVTSKQLESLSGAVPGTLEAIYDQPGLQFGPGKKAARAKYQALKKDAGSFRLELMYKKTKKGLIALEHKDFVNNANNAKGLTPIEALEARKSLDKIKKTLPPETFNTLRDKFDATAKKVFSSADKAYRDAVISESARMILPQNKYGGTSAFKIGIQTALSKLGDANSSVVGNMIAAGMSPAAQSAVAGAAGTLAKIGPKLGGVPAAGTLTVRSIAQNFPKMKKDATAGKNVKDLAGNLAASVLPGGAPSASVEIAKIVKKLTIDKALEYLKQAKGNRDKARELAKKDGFTIPKSKQ